MDKTDSVVAKLDIARTALAEAKTIQETKVILDTAAAAEIYARRQKLGDEAIFYATSIKVEALKRLGNMLKETPRAAARFDEGNKKVPSSNDNPTLADLGIDKKVSSLAQKTIETKEELTTSEFLKYSTKLNQENNRSNQHNLFIIPI